MALVSKMRNNWSACTWFITLPLMMATACSTIDVTTDYDPRANFSTYRTYAWLPRTQQSGQDPRLQSGLLDSRIHEAVAAELGSKGFRHEPTGKADLLVAYHVALQGKMDVSTVPNYPYWPSPWGATTSTYTRQYEEGSLILDLIDASKQHLVWRGSARAELTPGATPQEKQERINAAVHKMLAGYPPR